MSNPKTAHELLYGGDTDLGKFTLSDIQNPSETEDVVTVVARVQGRDALLYKEGVYEVVRTHDYEPIADKVDVPAVVDVDDIAEEYMPRRPRRRDAYPSLRGQYLTVREHRPDGSAAPRTRVIPVEYVISL